jgi:hypothetical protein
MIETIFAAKRPEAPEASSDMAVMMELWWSFQASRYSSPIL